jgi:8-oxo-dGTP diphosphatase
VKDQIRKLQTNHAKGSTKPLRHVVAALILRGEHPNREVLIGQRRPDQAMGLKWEFPGGKVEPGESAQEALVRELEEELGIRAAIGNRITTIHHTYRNGSTIQIQFFTVTHFTGEIDNRVSHNVRWSPLARLTDYDFLAADLALIRDLADGKLL